MVSDMRDVREGLILVIVYVQGAIINGVGARIR